MRILLFNHIENARESLRSNRLRTRLTVLGITLGVACMTTIMALSFGAIKLIDKQVDSLGGNLIVIRPGAQQDKRSIHDIASPGNNDSFSVSSLTEKDFATVSGMKNVAKAAPLMSVSGSVKSQHESVNDATIVATTPDLATVSNLKVRDGQFIDSITNANTAVIGNQLSVDLFGTNQSIGQTFKIRNRTFTVIGVLKTINTAVNYNNFNLNKTAIINLESGKKFNEGVAHIRQINIQAKNPNKIPELTNEIRKSIKKQHDNEEDFRVLSGSDISKPTSEVFTAIGAATSVVAVVSLIIGGIGIMNIMLVSVAERTREIGIRKAVGASNFHISMQFMIESLAMSLSGGIAGFILGYAAAFLVSTILPFNPGFEWYIPVISLGISAIIGTTFGMYPAIRAARKNPIEALRQYH
ncbi:ABC transporter permease [Candidatus Saccharibacteria bacterium]|nr:ABC transporter permease [Candidatus Saccharibacteria bacterium]